MTPLYISLVISIQLTTSQFTQTSLCLSGAADISYDGTYDYIYTKSNPWSGVWHNHNNQQYLYAWDFGNNTVEWRVGASYANADAYLTCPSSNS